MVFLSSKVNKIVVQIDVAAYMHNKFECCGQAPTSRMSNGAKETCNSSLLMRCDLMTEVPAF